MKAEIVIFDDAGRSYRGIVDLAPLGDKRRGHTSPQKLTGSHRKKPIRTAPEALRLLHRQSFFQERRSLKEISKKLEKMKFNFKGNTLSMALGEAPFLSRFGRRGNYTWGQKYPPEE